MPTSPLPAGSDPAGEATRRSRLYAIKLQTLVREHHGADGDPTPFPGGAALVADGEAWVLLADDPERRLGHALAWSLRQGVDALHVVADAGTGLLARRATQFATPISVWHAVERSLLPAVAESLPHPPAAPASHLALAELIRAGGATPVVEHGVVTGEVRGLEVCRVVDDPLTGAVRLEVGVGVHDREAFQLIHGDVPAVEALAGVVAAVRRYRSPDVPQHPLNRLAAERLLRWRLEQDPALVGASSLGPAEPPVPRPNLKDAMPCVASGVDERGEPMIVVCSSGVDLDLIPYAADARLAAARETGVDTGRIRTTVALPSRDRVPVTEEIARLLVQPLELVSVD